MRSGSRGRRRWIACRRVVASVVGIGDVLECKVAAAQAYATQIGFQFGGAGKLGEALRAFAVAEGGGLAAERFCGRAVI